VHKQNFKNWRRNDGYLTPPHDIFLDTPVVAVMMSCLLGSRPRSVLINASNKCYIAVYAVYRWWYRSVFPRAPIVLWRHCCGCAVSRDLCIGVPQNHTWQFFDPNLSIHCTAFMGLRQRLRGVLYYSIPMLKQFSTAKKLSSQNRSPKWRLFGNLRV